MPPNVADAIEQIRAAVARAQDVSETLSAIPDLPASVVAYLSDYASIYHAIGGNLDAFTTTFPITQRAER